MDFASPLLLLLISPVVLAGWFSIRRGVSKYLIISRVVILSLLIVALASPYTLGTNTIKDDLPRITVITDQTMSMDLFDKDTGKKVFEALRTKTSTTQRQFAGISSPIGDEVIQAADNNNLVLVSDGNNNYGKDLFDAISLVSRTGTRVFAVQQKPLHNDASVEIESPKNLIMGNPNEFNIVVRQAGDTTSYRLDVEIDGKTEDSEIITQTERNKEFRISYTFNSLGTHGVKATITPSSEDRFDINNEFYKSVFVVPKPKVLVVMDESLLSVTRESELPPLHQIINRMYDAKTASTLPDDLMPYKAVIIDNKGAAQLGVENLKTFVSNGGGLVVVGGEASYDRGNYNNSPGEAILPVISRAGEYRGGNSIVIVIDTSGSTNAGSGPDALSAYPEINANARHIVDKIEPGGNIGAIAFGGKIGRIDIRLVSSSADKDKLKGEIEKFYPGDDNNPTNLGEALNEAKKMLDSVSGTKSIIVLSDGLINPNEGFAQAGEIVKQNIQIRFVQVTPSIGQAPQPNDEYERLAESIGTKVEVLIKDQRLKITTEEPSTTSAPTPTPTPSIHEYPLAAVDASHFITRYANISAVVTGYNDVMPKLGSSLLVATMRGKPILTTWGFGLGRVASFTTDNGAQWSGGESGVYRGDNSRLISSMINWAIGDPRPTGNVVVQAEDIWAGTPGKVIITSTASGTLPAVKLDGTQLDLSRTGPSTYETSISPEKTGFHDLSGYGIAVNYPLEYREVGFNNEKFKSAIESNGGRVYNEDEVEGLMLLDIKEKSVRTVEEPKSEKEPFLLAALALFLIEVIIRRMKDYSKDRPQIEDNLPRAAPAVEAEAAE
ncbi:MAG: VWA domain-containing protein [Candidatus Methanoperedens sp.]|nr:VWA domain-containing protein [Candidatus Methanoperedens sp.]